jgi:hypothetical protein
MMSRGAATPDRRVARDQADPGGCDAHQRDGDKEGVLAPHPVAQIAEQDRAKRPEREADRERRPGEQGRKHLVPGREEAALEDPGRGESAPDEEVVPFEHCADRRRADHHPDLLRFDFLIVCNSRGHRHPPPHVQLV